MIQEIIFSDRSHGGFVKMHTNESDDYGGVRCCGRQPDVTLLLLSTGNAYDLPATGGTRGTE